MKQWVARGRCDKRKGEKLQLPQINVHDPEADLSLLQQQHVCRWPEMEAEGQGAEADSLVGMPVQRDVGFDR